MSPYQIKKPLQLSQNALLSATLFSFKILWYFFLSFLHNLLQKLFCFMYDRKLFALLVLKYLVVYWDLFMIAFLRSFVIYGSSRPKVFCKKGFLRNFAKFIGKHLCQSLFFNKVADLRPATLLKKDSGIGVFL